jgi:hypothetical protein
MVRSVHEIARYTKIHIRYSILISGKLRYLATRWSQRCRISQLLLYVEVTLHSFQYWNVVAYTTAEEYDLEKLSKGLLQQNLYVPNPPLRSLADPNQVGKRYILVKTILKMSVELTSTSHSVEQNMMLRWPWYQTLKG